MPAGFTGRKSGTWKMLRALFEADVEFILISGAAMQMQGYARSAKNSEQHAIALGAIPPQTQKCP